MYTYEKKRKGMTSSIHSVERRMKICIYVYVYLYLSSISLYICLYLLYLLYVYISFVLLCVIFSIFLYRSDEQDYIKIVARLHLPASLQRGWCETKAWRATRQRMATYGNCGVMWQLLAKAKTAAGRPLPGEMAWPAASMALAWPAQP